VSRTVCTTDPLGQFSISRPVCLGAGRRVSYGLIQVGVISYITVYMTSCIRTDFLVYRTRSKIVCNCCDIKPCERFSNPKTRDHLEDLGGDGRII